MMKKTAKILTLSVFSLVFFALLSVNIASGAGEDILLSWKTDSFVPAQYLGKRLPTGGSKVAVLAQVIKDGRVSSASQYEATWFLNKKIVAQGKNITKLEFVADEAVSQYEVILVLANSSQGTIEQTIVVPVVKSKLIIDSPYYENFVGAKDIRLNSLPYFFNVASEDEISVSWTINDNVVAIRSKALTFDIATDGNSTRTFPVMAKAEIFNGALTTQVLSQKLILGLRAE